MDGGIFWWPKTSGPVAEEGTNDGLHFAARDGSGFSPTGKLVEAGKEECLTVGVLEGSNQGKVDVGRREAVKQ